MCVLTILSPTALAQPTATSTGSATAKGGGPFTSSTLPIAGAGQEFDTEQQEIELKKEGQGEAKAGARVRANVDAGLLGWSSGATANSGGFIFDGQARSDSGFFGIYNITSDTLPAGTPVVITFRMTISVTETVFHTNGMIAAPQGSRNSASVFFDLRSGANRWRESGTRNKSNSSPEPVFSGLQNGTSIPNGGGSLHEDGGRTVNIAGVVGGSVSLEIDYTAIASVAVQFVDQRGRSTLCGSLGFGLSTDSDEVVLIPRGQPDPVPPPPAEIITIDYVRDFTPPDPVGGCELDINGDGRINFLDPIELLRLFDEPSIDADWNNDQLVNWFDIENYLQSFAFDCVPVIN